MITDAREISRYFKAAKWNFNKAIELAKKNVIVGEVNFPVAEKKVRVKKVKVAMEAEGNDLSNLDKDNKFYKEKK